MIACPFRSYPCDGKATEVEKKVESDKARQRVDFMLDDVVVDSENENENERARYKRRIVGKYGVS